jgi:hypothetical protein
MKGALGPCDDQKLTQRALVQPGGLDRREHSDNMKGTFREHSGHIQGTFREHAGDVQ